MSLLPLARRLVANKALDRMAGAAAPAPAAEAMPEPAGSPTVGELEAAVAEAQARLEHAAQTAAMRHDPYRSILTGLSAALGVFPKAVEAVVAARHPLTPEERADLRRELSEATNDGAYQGMRKEAARMIRRLDRGLAIRIGFGVGGAFAAGCLFTLGVSAFLGAGPFRPDVEAGAAWRELVQNNPDPRPALTAGEVRTDRATGRRYYAGVSLWLDPPRAPPPAAAARPQGSP